MCARGCTSPPRATSTRSSPSCATPTPAPRRDPCCPSSRHTSSSAPPANHSPSTVTSRTLRPVTTPQQEYPAPSRQSQPLNRNIPHPPANHSPSTGMSRTL
eukprot:3634757-Pyramimonas_sp.AAC.1